MGKKTSTSNNKSQSSKRKSISGITNAIDKIANQSTKTSDTRSTTAKSRRRVASLATIGVAASVAATTKNKKVKTVAIILIVIVLLAGCVFGYWYADSNGYLDGSYISGELEIHFLELGNRYSGDSIFIKAGDIDILVDGGSRESSADTIKKYIDKYCKDGVLEYLVVTHADQDHIAALAGNNTYRGIFDLYQIDTIIDFALTNKDTAVYKRYVEKRAVEVAGGANHYTALQCYNESNGAKRKYQLTDSIYLEILYQEFYETHSSDENNYSVCFQIDHSGRKFLFTGDLEKEGEQSLAMHNDWAQPIELFKAGHHGSKTSSTSVLLAEIRPKIVCVCCCAGSTEYTTNNSNTFPTQDMIDRVAVYTDKVYVTTLCIDYQQGEFQSMNGNIKVSSVKNAVTVEGSNNSTILKNTQWFADFRTMPLAWGG